MQKEKHESYQAKYNQKKQYPELYREFFQYTHLISIVFSILLTISEDFMQKIGSY